MFLVLIPVIVLSAIGFVRYPVQRSKGAFTSRKLYRKDQQAVAELLRGVGEGDSVSATTFYTTALSSRRELYDIKYAPEQQILHADVIVIDGRYYSDFKRWATNSARTNGAEMFRRRLQRFGYTLEAEYGGRIEVYRKK